MTAPREPAPGRADLARGGPVLVTGAAGFVGSWLVPALLAHGAAVVATARPGERPGDARASWRTVELTDPAAVRALVAASRPAAVVHLAAMAVPRDAQAAPEAARAINVGAVERLIDALASEAPHARLLYVSSGEVYGRRPRAAPAARETDPLFPEGVYATTKAEAEAEAARACAERGLDVVRVRPFNHTGPGRPERYAEASFARQIADAERGLAEPCVRVGNLDAIRDFCDVRDVVRAYVLLLSHARTGEAYNVCSGRGRAMREMLDILLAMARVSVRSEVDTSRYDPTPDGRVALVGDPTKLASLGWERAVPLEQTLRDVLDDWRARALHASAAESTGRA